MVKGDEGERVFLMLGIIYCFLVEVWGREEILRIVVEGI